MEKIFLNENNINLCRAKINSEYRNSFMYLKDDDLIKIIKRTEKETLDVLNHLYKMDRSNNFALPKYTVYSETKDKLLGYGMKYYKGYTSLNSIFYSNLTYKERLKLAKKLCTLSQELENNDIAFWDCHSFNYIVDEMNNEIVCCDMDSATIKNIHNNKQYKMDLLLAQKRIASLICGVMYDIDEIDFEFYLKRNYNEDCKLHKISNNKQRNTFEFILSDEEDKIIRPEEYIYTFNEDYIHNTKKLILK